MLAQLYSLLLVRCSDLVLIYREALECELGLRVVCRQRLDWYTLLVQSKAATHLHDLIVRFQVDGRSLVICVVLVMDGRAAIFLNNANRFITALARRRRADHLSIVASSVLVPRVGVQPRYLLRLRRVFDITRGHYNVFSVHQVPLWRL